MLLTRGSKELTLGNFLGDMIKNEEVKQLPEEVARGVAIHRFIDSYTDNHPVVRKHVRVLRPVQGKYAPVAVDVMYDHILAQQWKEFMKIAYPVFCKEIYASIRKVFNHVPPRLNERAGRMLEHKWLDGYDSESHFAYTLGRLNQRTQFPSQFHLVLNQYKANKKTFEEGFRKFFPDLIKEVEQRISLQNETIQ